MKTYLYHFNALWMILMLPLAMAQCPTGIKDLHALEAGAKSETGGFVSVSTSSSQSVSLEFVNKVHDVGCDDNAKETFAYKVTLLPGDDLRIGAPAGGGTLQYRTVSLLDTGCPGTLAIFGGIKTRCLDPTLIYQFRVQTKEDVLIFLQPNADTDMRLFWHYTPNPARQVNTCDLSNNNVCDYKSGKCLVGTDCTDCGGSNCKANECFVRYVASTNWPGTCDGAVWKTRSDGPWDCKALEREMRRDCSGCACEYTDPCTDEFKNTCRAANRHSCTRGSNKCGGCTAGYVEKNDKCQPNPCDEDAKKVCQSANKHTCGGASFECGDCLPGFRKVSNICVDVSKCTTSNIPSKMVILIDTSGSLDNPRSGGRYGNFAAVKNFAKDLINVFPINEFAIRSFSNRITPYPASGKFVTRQEAGRNVDAIRYDNSVTNTGLALEQTVSLLEEERDSLNMVLVFTDGKATDGTCKTRGETCNKDTQMCQDSNGKESKQSCKLVVQAEKLQNLPDRNATVTVVSVGFGNVNADELRLMASGEGDANTIIAQGADASAGLKKMEQLVGNIVDKVCLNLPVDCVITFTEWSECPDECGEHWQSRKIESVIEAKNNGKACPTGKARNKNYYQKCPERKCTTTTPTPTTTPASTTKKDSANTAGNDSTNTASATGNDSSNTASATGNDSTNSVSATGNDSTNTASATGNDSTNSVSATGNDSTNSVSATGNDPTNNPQSTSDPVSDDKDEVTDASVVNTFTWTLATAFSATMLVV